MSVRSIQPAIRHDEDDILLAVTSLKDSALAYARQGLPVFPLQANSKKPLPGSNGFKDATTDLATIEAWWSEDPDRNIGHSPEDSEHGVIDLDSGGDIKPLQLPETLTTITPSGGRHYWFRGSLPSGASNLGQHIDTRGKGGYVLLPPSRIDGKVYEWVDYNIDPVELPAHIAAKLKPKAKAAKPAVEDLDLPGSVITAKQRIKDLVRRKDVAISRSGGNTRTYRLACELVRDLGLSVEKALEVVAPWNEACVPPWSPGELEVLFRHAAAYGQNAPGSFASRLASEVFVNNPHVVRTDDKSPTRSGELMQSVAFSDLGARPIKPLEELVPGWIEKGIATMLSGPGGSNKSRLALQLGLCLQAGAKVFGHQTTQCTFLYLDYENGSDEVARRIQKMGYGLKLKTIEGARYYDFKTMKQGDGAVPAYEPAPALATISDADGVKLEPLYFALYDALRAIPGHKFVVMDSCYNVLRFTGNTKINETAVKMALNILDHLCVATDSTILYLWHPSQAGIERGDSSGWSVAWHNTPRARLSIMPVERSSDTYELKVEKRNNGRVGERLTLHWHNGVLLPTVELGGKDQGELLLEACIRLALDCADGGEPIKRQKKLPYFQLLAIEKEVGFTVTNNDVKEQLDKAVYLKKLRYVRGHGKDVAGYFPYNAHPYAIRNLGAQGYAREAARHKMRTALAEWAKATEDATLEAAVIPNNYREDVPSETGA